MTRKGLKSCHITESRHEMLKKLTKGKSISIQQVLDEAIGLYLEKHNVKEENVEEIHSPTPLLRLKQLKYDQLIGVMVRDV